MHLFKQIQKPRSRNFIILLLIAILAIFYSVHIRPGHDWGDDFALYILHARNIAEGRPYTDTGFIPNTLAHTYSPQNYSPGFPLLLAPVYALWGLNFTAMKIYMLLFAMAFLLLIYYYLKNKLPFYQVFLVIALVGFSSFTNALSGSILSDFPSACFLFAALLAEEKRIATNKTAFIVLEIFFIYFAYLIRATNILFLPAILLGSIIREKRLGKAEWIILISLLVCMFIQQFIITWPGGYWEILKNGYTNKTTDVITSEFFERANRYLYSFANILTANGDSNSMAKFFSTFILCLALVGFYFTYSEKITHTELFFVFMLGVVFIFPGYQGLRYLLAIVPVYLFYFFRGLNQIHFKRVRRFFLAVFLIVFLILNNQFYNFAKRNHTNAGVLDAAAQDFFSYIQRNTQKDAVIMSRKPRAFCLFTERKGIVFPDEQYADSVAWQIKNKNVSYIATTPVDKGKYTENLFSADTIHYSSIYKEAGFEFFKIK